MIKIFYNFEKNWKFLNPKWPKSLDRILQNYFHWSVSSTTHAPRKFLKWGVGPHPTPDLMVAAKLQIEWKTLQQKSTGGESRTLHWQPSLEPLYSSFQAPCTLCICSLDPERDYNSRVGSLAGLIGHQGFVRPWYKFFTLEVVKKCFAEVNYSSIWDDSLTDYEVKVYIIIAGTNFNNPREIKINMQTQDIFTLPSGSLLFVAGQLNTCDSSTNDGAGRVARTNTCIMHLFRNATYQLSEKEVESSLVRVNLLPCYAYWNILMNHRGELSCCFLDEGVTAVLVDNKGFATRKKYIIQCLAWKGTFSFRIYIKHFYILLCGCLQARSHAGARL